LIVLMMTDGFEEFRDFVETSRAMCLATRISTIFER